jgi:methylated-DNA-[protein]-cysteine S-methyltransferase
MKKINIAGLSYCLRTTPFGPIAVMWSIYLGCPKISRVLLVFKSGGSANLPVETSYPDAISASCSEIDAVANQMVAFLTGADIRFSLDLARLDLCNEFQRRVLYAEHGIPRGKVSTYARIACYLGKAKAARAVGSALANNPFPLIIPCHRAIRSDGTLGGFQGGINMKRTLLEMGGVPFNAQGRVVKEESFFYARNKEYFNHPQQTDVLACSRHAAEIDR